METDIKNKRWSTIDRFRGLIVFCMILFQCIEHFPSLGVLTRICQHGENGIYLFNDLMLADIVAPMFFLVISMTLIPSFLRRCQKDGKREAYKHFILRNLEIVGLGGTIHVIDYFFNFINETKHNIEWKITLIRTIVGIFVLLFALFRFVCIFIRNKDLKNISMKMLLIALAVMGALTIYVGVIHDIFLLIDQKDRFGVWGVLQAIGLSCLFATPFLNKNTKVRAIAAISFMAVFAILYYLPQGDHLIDIEVQGGVIGCLSWASLVLGGTVFADLWYKDQESKIDGKFFSGTNYSLYMFLGTAVVGVLSALFLRLNKGAVSPGFIFVTFSMAIFSFLVFSIFEKYTLKFDFLAIWGKSPLLMFIFQYLFVNIPLFIIDVRHWGVFPSIIFVTLLTLGFTCFNYFLDKRKLIIKA